MERVAFLIEETGERLGCLLNPDSLTMRRTAGVLPRRSSGGQFTGIGLRDDPLLYTGGGRTELELKLLFDISLAGSSIETHDVRDLTGPLWRLAENMRGATSRLPPAIRFVWGKSWNIPGIVVAVAEKLEQFTADGAPQRSWLSMRLWRVNESQNEEPADGQSPQGHLFSPANLSIPPGSVPVDHTKGRVVSAGERLDEIASQAYPDQPAGPSLWRLIASYNNIEDPFALPAGSVLTIPPLTALGGEL
ncbi:MAG TPA: hypothetical protein VGD98_03330 [Ktedonobacteraceae bacterium]